MSEQQLEKSFEIACTRVFRKVLLARGVYPSQVAAADPSDLISKLTEVDQMLEHWEEFGFRQVRYREYGAHSFVAIDSDIRPALLRTRRHITTRIAATYDGAPLATTNLAAALGADPLEAEHIASVQHEVDAEVRGKLLAAYLSDRKFARWLAKESASVAVGAILLLLLTGALIGAMFSHTPVPEVLSNAFLLILGYFFGQSVQKRSRDAEKDE